MTSFIIPNPLITGVAFIFLTMGICIGTLPADALGGWLTALPLLALGVASFATAMITHRVEVDDHGIRVVRWLEGQVIPFSRISHVRRHTRRELRRGSFGSQVMVHTAVIVMERGGSIEIAPNDVDGFLEEARRRKAAAEDRAERREQRVALDPRDLDPPGTGARAWLDMLAAVREGVPGFRTAPTYVDDAAFWAVLESSNHPARRRVGAALALAPLRDPTQGGAIRRVADDLDESSRTLLEEVASGTTGTELEAAVEAWLAARA